MRGSTVTHENAVGGKSRRLSAFSPDESAQDGACVYATQDPASNQPHYSRRMRSVCSARTPRSGVNRWQSKFLAAVAWRASRRLGLCLWRRLVTVLRRRLWGDRSRQRLLQRGLRGQDPQLRPPRRGAAPPESVACARWRRSGNGVYQGGREEGASDVTRSLLISTNAKAAARPRSVRIAS